MIPAIHHPRLPVRLLGTLAVLLTMSAHAQGQPARQAAPSPAPGGNGLSVNIVTDTLKNKKYGKADDTFASYVYEVTPTSDGWKVELESKEVRGVWKGSDTLVELAWKDKGYFEESSQFAPAFLVAELRNDSPRAVQIAEAYLDVAESTTDRQPYLEIHSGLDLLCKGSDYDPKVELRNYGWGDVRNPRLVFSFSLKDARSPEFLAPLPAFDQRGTTTVEEALRKSGVNVAKLKAGKFKCPSKAQVPGCLGKLKDDLGDLTKYVRTDGTAVLADVTGRIEYEWTGTDGKSHSGNLRSRSPSPCCNSTSASQRNAGHPGRSSGTRRRSRCGSTRRTIAFRSTGMDRWRCAASCANR